jgi:hypothetical protein
VVSIAFWRHRKTKAFRNYLWFALFILKSLKVSKKEKPVALPNQRLQTLQHVFFDLEVENGTGKSFDG